MLEADHSVDGLYVPLVAVAASARDRPSGAHSLSNCTVGELVSIVAGDSGTLNVISCRGTTLGEVGGEQQDCINAALAGGHSLTARINSVHGQQEGDRRIVLRLEGLESSSLARTQRKSGTRLMAEQLAELRAILSAAWM